MSRASEQTITGEIACKTLERFPDAPALTLAKKIYKENPLVFHNVEHARRIICYYTGKSGDENRKDLKDKKFVRPARDTNPFNIPESDCDEWKPVHIKETDGLLFADSHFPYHDIIAINAMLGHAVKRPKINFILIDGDGLDFYQLSKFIKDPSKRSVNNEIWQWVEFLESLKKYFPNAKIYWKFGNHEERLEKYLFVKAPELIDMKEYRLGEIIKIRGITDIEIIEKQIIYAGRLPIVHGTEFQGRVTSAVNPARGFFLKSLSSVLGADKHITSSHSETDINGKLLSTFSIGCLCGLHTEYARLNKWNHGFAYLTIDKQEFSIENMKIYNGNVYHA